MTHHLTPEQLAAVRRDLETNRSALALVGAAQNGDNDGVLAILGTVEAVELGQFLVALAGMVAHALAAPPEVGWPGFLAAYADALDTTEDELRTPGT